MPTLGVIGNISIDTVLYPGGQQYELLGGAALHVALAAAHAGLHASPVSVIGDDLTHLHTDPRLAEVDLARVLTVGGTSTRFEITYNPDGTVTHVTSKFGVAEVLTEHAITVIAGWEFDHWHICCRRPLNTARVLAKLVAAELPFSLDFHLASAAEQITAAATALPHATTVFVNTTEHKTLIRLAGDLLPESLPVIVSDGPRPVTLLRYGRPTATATPDASQVGEVTGAGDTLAGTFLAATACGASDHDALQTAVAAASAKARRPGLSHHPRQPPST
jgi:sugar/nucleoside kinase (ribokinase family)